VRPSSSSQQPLTGRSSIASQLLYSDAGSLTAGVTSTHANDSGGIIA
jgi:hypothetical protein